MKLFTLHDYGEDLENHTLSLIEQFLIDANTLVEVINNASEE